MRSRWFWFSLCLVAGLGLLGCGLLVPVHLRAVDASVILSAGRPGDALLARGQGLASAGRLGAAQLYVTAARQADMPGWDRLGDFVTNRAARNSAALFWGDDTRTKALFTAQPPGQTLSSFLVRRENREPALAHLNDSASPVVHELMYCRTLNRTAIFPPAASVAGQAFDAALAECGLLLDANRLTPTLGVQIQELAQQANRGGGSRPLEEVLLDFISLGERMNWDQLSAFALKVPDVLTLHRAAAQMAQAGDRLPLLFAAVQLSGEPASVAGYLSQYPQTGLSDLADGLWYGANGVQKLTESGERFYKSSTLQFLAARNPLGAIYYSTAAGAVDHPRLVLALKWLCYLAAGFFLATAVYLVRPPLSVLELPLQVRGIHLVRQGLFSLGFLLVVLLLSEPFLAPDSQGETVSLQWRLPMAGDVVPAVVAGAKPTVMNPSLYLTLLVFFILQALLYISCLVKLAEIRRQQVPPRMKLKLLENEEHLFDAGLYLGFVGTIISLIVFSLGHVKFSLMSAYSSTSFGIIFVVIFKIFHLRPARRKLLLEAELAETAAARPSQPAVTTPALTS